MEERWSPYQRDRPRARRRKLEQSACNAAGLWGQESSSSDKMGKAAACVSAGSELARAGQARHRVGRSAFLFLVPPLLFPFCFPSGFSTVFPKIPKVNQGKDFYFPCFNRPLKRKQCAPGARAEAAMVIKEQIPPGRCHESQGTGVDPTWRISPVLDSENPGFALVRERPARKEFRDQVTNSPRTQ